MKKNILIVILSLLLALAMVFARMKVSEAERFGIEAQSLNVQVEQLTDITEVLKQKAQQAAADAVREKTRADKILQDCQSKK